VVDTTHPDQRISRLRTVINGHTTTRALGERVTVRSVGATGKYAAALTSRPASDPKRGTQLLVRTRP
jgi:hypothetical protein